MLLLEKLRLPPATTKASIRTQLNGNSLEWRTKHKEVGTGYWKLGIELEKRGEDYAWTTWTVENGCHIINFTCIITASGRLVDGVVNLFALGFMRLDQGYVDDLLGEYDHDPPQWETVRID